MRSNPPSSWTPILACLLFCAELSLGQVPGDAERQTFDVRYSVWIKPETARAVVKIRLSDKPQSVRWLELSIDPDRHRDFLCSGKVEKTGAKVKWQPPAKDAWLQFDVDLMSARGEGRFDGYLTPDWALFRADDLVPPIRSDIEDGTMSRATLQFHLPEDWSVTTRHPKYSSGRYKVDDPDRLFDRPTGWLVMGKIGTVREQIGRTKVVISAPVGQDARRMDILALYQWTLPVMQELFPCLPERLLVVSAGDPMWRGALSGPGSLYVHSDRPLISNDGTSTFVHEMVHVAMGARSGPQADWIVEGLAEYYSLEVLRRSGTLSESRYKKALAHLAERGRDVESLEVDRCHGPITAKAVGELHRIDQEIRRNSEGKHSLDDVVRALAEDRGPVTRERFFELVESASGG